MKQNDPRLSRLQKFFGDRDCPLRDSAKDFLIAADQNQLDWRLLPSISMIESSGGKDYGNNNVFGWGSCKERFSSVRAGIHYVAAQLGKSRRYKGKDIDSEAADLQSAAGVLPTCEGCHAGHRFLLPATTVSGGLIASPSGQTETTPSRSWLK